MKLEDFFNFGADRNVTVIMVAVVLGIYAKITGDTGPFSVFAVIIILVFLFSTVNFLMGKLKQ